MLLRNIRSRIVTSKQAEAVMTDHTPKTSPTQNYTTPPIPTLFGNSISPRLFQNFTPKYPSDPESLLVSPTSILDTKPIYPAPGNPFNWYDRNLPKSPKISSGNKRSWGNLESGGIGLALVDTLDDEKQDKPNSSPKVNSRRKVLFGSQLKVQIPPLPPFPHSPTSSSPPGSANQRSPTEDPVNAFNNGCLSVSEMELSENYTCVISHGPNPRTIHIFDDRIVESSCGAVGSYALRKGKKEKKQDLSFAYTKIPESPLQNFLSFCYTCKRKLGQEKDIYIYRGEKAFCSNECRSREILFDEGGDF